MQLLRQGQNITISFPKQSKIIDMICTVEEIYDDRLSLAVPKYFMRYVECLQVGCKLTAKVFSKSGTLDFSTIVISSPLEDVFLIEFDLNSIKLTAGSDFQPIGAVEALEIKVDDNVIKTKTFEISNEHVNFLSDNIFEIGATIDCSLVLPGDYGIIDFRGIVTENNPEYKKEYKAVFSTMSEENRQKLLYYIYMYAKDSE